MGKCYFPLAEEQKKWKMFSHTQLGPSNIRVLEGGQVVLEHIFVVACMTKCPPTPAPLDAEQYVFTKAKRQFSDRLLQFNISVCLCEHEVVKLLNKCQACSLCGSNFLAVCETFFSIFLHSKCF